MMSPETIGIMGSTQGVNESATPAPSDTMITQNRLAFLMTSAKRSCSET